MHKAVVTPACMKEAVDALSVVAYLLFIWGQVAAQIIGRDAVLVF